MEQSKSGIWAGSLLAVLASTSAMAGPIGPVVVDGQGSDVVYVLLERKGPSCPSKSLLDGRKFGSDIQTALQTARFDAGDKAVGDAIVKCATHPIGGLEEGRRLAFTDKCNPPISLESDCGRMAALVCTAKMRMLCVPIKVPQQSNKGVQAQKAPPSAPQSSAEAKNAGATDPR